MTTQAPELRLIFPEQDEEWPNARLKAYHSKMRESRSPRHEAQFSAMLDAMWLGRRGLPRMDVRPRILLTDAKGAAWLFAPSASNTDPEPLYSTRRISIDPEGWETRECRRSGIAVRFDMSQRGPLRMTVAIFEASRCAEAFRHNLVDWHDRNRRARSSSAELASPDCMLVHFSTNAFSPPDVLFAGETWPDRRFVDLSHPDDFIALTWTHID